MLQGEGERRVYRSMLETVDGMDKDLMVLKYNVVKWMMRRIGDLTSMSEKNNDESHEDKAGWKIGGVLPTNDDKSACRRDRRT